MTTTKYLHKLCCFAIKKAANTKTVHSTFVQYQIQYV